MKNKKLINLNIKKISIWGEYTVHSHGVLAGNVPVYWFPQDLVRSLNFKKNNYFVDNDGWLSYHKKK